MLHQLDRFPGYKPFVYSFPKNVNNPTKKKTNKDKINACKSNRQSISPPSTQHRQNEIDKGRKKKRRDGLLFSIKAIVAPSRRPLTASIRTDQRSIPFLLSGWRFPADRDWWPVSGGNGVVCTRSPGGDLVWQLVNRMNSVKCPVDTIRKSYIIRYTSISIFSNLFKLLKWKEIKNKKISEKEMWFIHKSVTQTE